MPQILGRVCAACLPAAVSSADAQVVYAHLSANPPLGSIVTPGVELGEYVTLAGGQTQLALAEVQFGALGATGAGGMLHLAFYTDNNGLPFMEITDFTQPINVSGEGLSMVSFDLHSLPVFPAVWVSARFEPTSGEVAGVALTSDSPAVGAVSSVHAFRGGSASPWSTATATSWMQMRLTAAPPRSCYVNCDAGTTPPCLNVLDFGCFLGRFATGLPYANCDGSTMPPFLNTLDFMCFLNRFAAGCSSC